MNHMKFRTIAAVVLTFALLSVLATSPSQAYDTADDCHAASPGFGPNAVFELRPRTFTFPYGTFTLTPTAGVVDGAAAAWSRFGQDRAIARVNTSNNWVGFVLGTEIGGSLARASAPCRNGAECRVRVSVDANWSSNTLCTPNVGLDLMSTVTHEFGHWLGSGHSGAADRPSSSRNSGDGTANTMVTGGTTNCDRRTVEQDDVNIALHGEAGNSNISSNMGFEDAHPGATFFNGGLNWIFLPSTNGTGSAARYWHPANAYQGSLFVQFHSGSGTAASIYQDLFTRGAGVSVVTPNVRIRNDAGGTQIVQLVVWEIDAAGGPSANIHNCMIPAGGYHYCGTSFSVNSDFLRLQVYNYTSGNISVDNFRMTANG